MDNLFPLLNGLGLNEKEAKVYLACLELGLATVQAVAKKSGVKRTSIYNFLDELKDKGLVNEITRDSRVYLVPEHPQALIAQAEIKKRAAEDEKKKIQELMPELSAIFNLPSEKPKVKFYEGLVGIKKVYEDTLSENETIYAFTDYDKLLAAIEPDYMIDYANRRAAKNIPIFSISPPGPWTKKAIEMGEAQKREVKVIEGLKFETEINIYGKKVALISFRRPHMGVIIESGAIAQTLKSIWKAMWND